MNNRKKYRKVQTIEKHKLWKSIWISEIYKLYKSIKYRKVWFLEKYAFNAFIYFKFHGKR